ncbi:MAG: hypothetical protein V4584_05510 [Verrucomicrobiota bacterium]
MSIHARPPGDRVFSRRPGLSVSHRALLLPGYRTPPLGYLPLDPYLIGQAHVSYTFRPGLWLCASTGYGYGGESTINGASADDRKGNLAWGLSLGIPVSCAMGFKLAYIGARTQENTGADTDTFSIGFSVMW